MEWQSVRMRSSRALLEKTDFICIKEWRMPCLRMLSKTMRALMESNSEDLFAWLLCLCHGANRNLIERTLEQCTKRAFLSGIIVNPRSQSCAYILGCTHSGAIKATKLESIPQDTCKSVKMGLTNWPTGLKQTDLTLNNNLF